jgi:hypothetical protein
VWLHVALTFVAAKINRVLWVSIRKSPFFMPSHANLPSLPSHPDAEILLSNLLGEAGGVRATAEVVNMASI